jgi:hypothetical protein
VGVLVFGWALKVSVNGAQGFLYLCPSRHRYRYRGSQRIHET